MFWYFRFREGKTLSVCMKHIFFDSFVTQFITLQATFLPSIIGLPLSLLAALPTPMREVPLSERKAMTISSASTDDASRGPKPVKEVWRLLEYLMAHGAGVPDLWMGEVELDDLLEIVEVCPFEYSTYFSAHASLVPRHGLPLPGECVYGNLENAISHPHILANSSDLPAPSESLYSG